MSSSSEMTRRSSRMRETCAVLLAGEDIPLVRPVRILSDSVDLLALFPILLFGVDFIKEYCLVSLLSVLAPFRKRPVRLRV